MFFYRMSFFLFLIATAVSGLPLTDSAPTGIGSMADNGCVCHGAQSNATVVAVLGLPAQFESAQTYNITLEIESSVVQSQNTSIGGFRILVSDGTLEPENSSLVHIIDDGWTHNFTGSASRAWNFTWTAPSDNTTSVDFVAHGNAVNGNGNSMGDIWNSYGIQVPGSQYVGDIAHPNVSDELNAEQYTILYGGLVVLFIFLYRTIK